MNNNLIMPLFDINLNGKMVGVTPVEISEFSVQLNINGFIIDLLKLEVYPSWWEQELVNLTGKAVRITPMFLRIITALIKNYPARLPHYELMKQVNPGFVYDKKESRNGGVHIHNLRKLFSHTDPLFWNTNRRSFASYIKNDHHPINIGYYWEME